ncbi:FtsB family cell division protein [Suttonella ornithocola]|uniref:Cell division protein FtsB n=1 Tax=Suttonella ornithocola TaxID=279832 RepID=A0A380MS18_9GAMM|nr:septum formation initiator family protein [Suttonella ornithocola]SUO95355.1 cell division protein FtsB [Suttonella ornithocola]
MLNKRLLPYGILIAIAIALGAFNYYLWQLQAGKKQLITGLQSQVILHQKENKLLTERNLSKSKEVETLRSPDSYYLYEEKAREEYGMIGEDETFFVLMRDETKTLPNIPDLENKSDEKDTLAIPQSAQDNVITLESIVEPPSVSPAIDAPPLQLESLE